MVAVTFGVTRVPAAAKAGQETTRTPWYARFYGALVESRAREARRQIAMHSHLLPYGFDERGDRLVKRGSENMPFGGW